jgi:hypothetical protein
MSDNQEIDLKDDGFSIREDSRMLIGHCAMFADEKLMYAGHLRGSPEPQAGWVVVLHPDDFNSLSEAYRKALN